ncbi:restriction endonuclease subunit S [Vibrio maritimus]|uniref:restriction endonuclease subunit S n=1 Tax=Vibrio maritimus TaxID=990268 RepID=UPI001F3BDE50|nr:restriction endonuclease subunit S [Vibrio maritimus]
MSFDNLPRSWQLISLEDAMDAIIDYRGKTPKKTESGIPLITAKIVKGGYVLEPFEFIAEDNYDSWMVRGLPQVGDVVLTTEAPLGETAQLTSANVALAQRIVTLRGKRGVLDNDFLLCALQSDFVQHQLESRASGSTVKGIKQSELRKVSLPIPPLPEQQKISQVLKSLSNKLVCNTQTNQTLEEMAQAIFKSWFVDFDPIKAKMSGEQPEAMDAATASLFPEKLVESELGLIPEGWDVGTLSDVAKYCSARTNTDTITLENYISTENMLAEKKGVTAASKLPTAKTVAAYKSGDILVSNIRPYFKKIWLAEGSGGRSNDVLGFESVSENTDSYVMNLLYQDTFFEYMTRTSKGAKMPRGDKTAIMNWEMAVPPVELREAFSAIVDKFYQLIPQNRAQNATLESLRDTLLPKLLSGEIELDSQGSQ